MPDGNTLVNGATLDSDGVVGMDLKDRKGAIILKLEFFVGFAV